MEKKMTANVMRATPKVEALDTGIEGREKLAANMTACTADSIVLMIKSQTYHWNVVGPLFFSLHQLTEEHYRDLFDASDALAERVRALGHPVPAGLNNVLKTSIVKDAQGEISAEDMIADLASDHEAVAKRFRQAVELAEEHNDPVSADMLTERIQFHEKAVWMLRAILTT
jgi:starvation-inducible DNA-binding protein